MYNIQELARKKQWATGKGPRIRYSRDKRLGTSFVMNEALANAITEYATKHDMSVGAVIRRACSTFLLGDCPIE